MGLDMALDILLATETLVALVVRADPLPVSWVGALDVHGDVIHGDARVRFGFLDVDVGDAGGAGNGRKGLGSPVR